MTLPRLRIVSAPLEDANGDLLVIGVRKTPDGPVLAAPAGTVPSLEGSLSKLGVTGASDELARVLPLRDGGPAVALVGLGEGLDEPALRNAAGAVTRQVRGLDSIVFALPVTDAASAQAVLEGAALGSYRFTEYRSAAAEPTSRPAGEITVLATLADEEAAAVVEAAETSASAIELVRDLVNTPPSDLYPASFADRAVREAEALRLEVEVLDEAALAEGGYGGLLGVGRGSSRGPRLVRVRYAPEGAQRHLALVGKGITFDTGGLSLKPAASMVGMKYDMTGAATALAVLLAVARRELPVRLTAWLCLAENMPSGDAIRPNDVLTMLGGKTVEVLNTDAEGRLVLADGLVAASEERPDAIIDIATLTGAAKVALGDRYTAIMGDDTLASELVAAGEGSGELFWQLPLPGYLREVLRSDVADIANAKPGNTAAGTMLAGVFLQEFVGDQGENGERIPWLHLDIASTANNEGSPRGHLGAGPTGVGVLSLIALAEQVSQA
ncbi:leucyl aminopeptidase [Ruicaihuangia caeni]|uniref:leucyl aminopeptidase n=1 Tax=Ruicaihuangia caeni TaxID=3042517 RepID=UPI00338F794C